MPTDTRRITTKSQVQVSIDELTILSSTRKNTRLHIAHENLVVGGPVIKPYKTTNIYDSLSYLVYYRVTARQLFVSVVYTLFYAALLKLVIIGICCLIMFIQIAAH